MHLQRSLFLSKVADLDTGFIRSKYLLLFTRNGLLSRLVTFQQEAITKLEN